MKKNIRIAGLAVVVATLFAAQFASAANCVPGELCSPLNSAFSSVPNFIAGFLRVMVMVALPIISLFIVYSGFLFVSARGNTGKLETARNNFVYVIVGAILILGAWVIATMIGGTVQQLTTG